MNQTNSARCCITTCQTAALEETPQVYIHTCQYYLNLLPICFEAQSFSVQEKHVIFLAYYPEKIGHVSELKQIKSKIGFVSFWPFLMKM